MRPICVLTHRVARPLLIAGRTGYRVGLDCPHVFLRSGGPLDRLDRPHLDALDVDILTCLPLVLLLARFEFLRG